MQCQLKTVFLDVIVRIYLAASAGQDGEERSARAPTQSRERREK